MNVWGSNRGSRLDGAILAIAMGACLMVPGALWLAEYLPFPGPSSVRAVEARAARSQSHGASTAPEYLPILERRLADLRTNNLLASDQAVLVESLEGETMISHNADSLYNPASVLKMATTLVALDRFGPSHRFRTA